MTYMDVNTTSGPPAHFLDVAPMISALQFQPTDFELSQGWLRHVPSHHRFKFDKTGRMTIDARCDCSGQSVDREQGDQLFKAFTSWRQYYWQPLEIDCQSALDWDPGLEWAPRGGQDGFQQLTG